MPFEEFAFGYFFPEGIRWHDGRVWLSDVRGDLIWSLDPDADDGDPRSLPFPAGSPSGLGWMPDGTLVAVAMEARSLLRLEPDGSFGLHADLTGPCRGFANDAVQLSDGTFVVGDMGITSFGDPGSDRFPGRLLVVSPAGVVEQVIADVDTANGIAVDDDEDLLVVAETERGLVTAFDLRERRLTGRRSFAPLPTPDAGSPRPDGICMDASGAVWAANLGGAEVVRLADGGQVLERIPLPGLRPTACVLGGPDRTTLFVCAVSAPNQAEVVQRPTGIVLRIAVEVPGAGKP